MRVITLEEHFVTRSFLKATNAYRTAASSHVDALESQLLDLGAGRIAAMDESGIDLQVLSLVAMGLDRLDSDTANVVAKEANDELAEAVKARADRFAGLAVLGLKDAASAAAELERCVTKLGFLGAMVNGTTDGLFLDDARFAPVFEAASELDVPIYLHPAPPPASVEHAYYSGLPGELGHLLSIAGWGWHAETALHTLRLIVSGVFDRLPKLQVVIGHMGEGLPYALARSSAVLSRGVPKLRQPVSEYFKTNIHLTTSGYFTEPPLRCAVDVVGMDRIMFSVDYPFSPNTRGRAYLQELSEVFSDEEIAEFTHGNAERLFKLHQS